MAFVAGQRVLASQLNAFSIIPLAPTSTVSNGTASTGAETLDIVLGVYQPILVAGIRYKVCLDGLIGNGGAVADNYSVRIRVEESASTPTTSSTMVVESEWYCPATGTTGRTSIPLNGTYVPSVSGIHTFGCFSLRNSGSNTFTPVSPDVARQLYVMAVGIS